MRHVQTLGFRLSLIISVIPYLLHSRLFGLVYKTQIGSLLERMSILGRFEHEMDNSTFEQGTDSEGTSG